MQIATYARVSTGRQADILINNVPVQRQTVKSPDESYNEFIETLPDGTGFRIFESKNASTNPSSNEARAIYEVPTSQYFVVGDNRDNAHDSRNGRRYIPLEDIIGRAVLFFYAPEILH